MKRQIFRLITVLMMTLSFGSASAFSEISMEAEIGYNGVMLNGRWFPLAVHLSSDAEAFEGEISVKCMQTETEYDRYVYPVNLEAGDTTTVRFPISTLIPQLAFDVELVQGETVIAADRVVAERAVSDEAILVGVLGASESLLRAFSISAQNDTLGREETLDAVSLDGKLLQLTRKELAAFQLLVIHEHSLHEMDAKQKALVEQWVYEGGILIADAEWNSAWLNEAASIGTGAKAASLSALKALHRFAGMPHEDAVSMEVVSLEANDASLVSDEEDRCILAGYEHGEGYILATGFSLGDPAILSAARSNALWQRLLLAADKERYNALFISNHRRNYTFGSALNERQVIDAGKSVLPVLILLAFYLCLCGFGWFVLLKRCDRTGLMWLLLPATACAGFAAIWMMSGMLGFNEPTSASFRVTHYDTQGSARTEERALIAYADMQPVTITSEPNAAIERTEYGYFSGSMGKAKKTSLRDTVYLGERQGLELSAVAPWRARSLVIDTPLQMKGSVTGSVWMEEDGLHAAVCNGTDTALQEAYVFTALGYASIGDVQSGETRQVLIKKPESVLRKKDGSQAILDGVLLEYPVSLYTAIDASVFLQAETDPDFDQDDLPEAQLQAMNAEFTKRNFASSRIAEQYLPCVLYAKTPDLPCVQLYKDGEPIERCAQESILTCELAFRMQSENGHVYYPKGVIKPHTALLEEGVPVIGGEVEKRWYSEVREDAYFAFDFSEINGTEIKLVRIISEAYLSDDEPMHVEVYDTELNAFVKMPEPGNCALSGDLLRRTVNQQGKLFIRYSAAGERSGSLYLPEIIVEGSARQ